MKNNNSKILPLLITFIVLASGGAAYFAFAKPFTEKITSHSVKYVNYKMKEVIIPKDVSMLPNATSVPVIMYHGVVIKKDSSNTTLENFREQMEALKREGYETISVKEFDLFKQGKFTLPKKPIIITFDDGRKDSYYTTDDILSKLGFKATIFLASGPMIDGNLFYLTKDELQTLNQSGRWEMQAHGRYSHKRINTEIKKKNEEDQTFLSSKMFLVAENRFETEDEFKVRVENDYIVGNADVKAITGTNPEYIAIPLNDYGISENTNFPEAFDINTNFVKKYYKIAFVQSNVNDDVTKVLSSPFNMSFEDPFKTRRLEIKNMSAEEMIKILNETTPGPANFTLTSENFKNIAPQKISGKLDLVNNLVSILSPIAGGNGLFSIGEPFWKNYSVSLDLENISARSVAILLNYIDWNNYVVCGYTDNSYFLREVIDGQTINLESSVLPEAGTISNPNNILGSSNNGLISCGSKDGVVFKNIKSKSISGGSGVLIWDDQKQASAQIKSFVVSQN